MNPLLRQGGTFAVVGVVATLVHYLAILALVDVLGWLRPTPATVIGSALGIATSYLGNHRAVFNVRGAHHRYGPRFVFVYLTVMGIHASLMFVSTEVIPLAHPGRALASPRPVP